MHTSSMKFMNYFIDNYLSKGLTILDVGSKIVDGESRSYRKLFEPNFVYTGMDLDTGDNVDLVGFESVVTVYDVVISGQVMEHVNRPWEWLKNLVKYYNKYICIIAPHTWKEHRHSIDTYRYFPDGMKDLFGYAGIKTEEILRNETDTMGIGSK